MVDADNEWTYWNSSDWVQVSVPEDILLTCMKGNLKDTLQYALFYF